MRRSSSRKTPTDLGGYQPDLESLVLLRAIIQGVSPHALAERHQMAAGVVMDTVATVRRQMREMAIVHGRADLSAALAPTVAPDTQLQAIRDILHFKPRQPALSDSTAQWLAHEAVALAAWPTLGALATHIEHSGPDWWQSIKRIGKHRAAKIEQFLRQRCGCTLYTHTTLLPVIHDQAPDPVFGLVPIERLLIPEHIDGEQGRNRSPGRCLLSANNDQQAIAAWLARYPATSHTHRAYRKEAERFLLWAVLCQQKALSDLGAEEGAAYMQFLAAVGVDPGLSHWIGPPAPRNDPAWRPFTGPLKRRSQAYAHTVLTQLCGWLTRKRYLDASPFDDVPAPVHDARLKTRHALTFSQEQHLLAYAQQLPHNKQGMRTQVMITLWLSTGLRIAEMCAASVGDLQISETMHNGVVQKLHWLRVTGKRQRERSIPLGARLVSQLQAYWAARGITRATHPELPLIPSLRGGEHMTPSGAHRILKTFFGAAANAIHDPDSAERIRSASAHWLRHTYATRIATDPAIPIAYAQAALGHVDAQTTMIYTTTDDAEMHRLLRED